MQVLLFLKAIGIVATSKARLTVSDPLFRFIIAAVSRAKAALVRAGCSRPPIGVHRLQGLWPGTSNFSCGITISKPQNPTWCWSMEERKQGDRMKDNISNMRSGCHRIGS